MDPGALLIRQERGRSLLHELLVPPLQRAVARAENHHVPVGVRHDLRLDMPGLLQEALHETLPAPERGDRLTRGGVEGGLDVIELGDDLHAATASTEGGLDDDRQTVRLSEGPRLGGVSDRAVRPWSQRRPGLASDGPGGHLVPQVPDHGRRGPDPGQPCVDHGLREVRVLRQEAVPGMDRVRAGSPRDLQQLFLIEIRLRSARALQRVGLVGQPHMHGVGVRIGIDGHGGVARIDAGADHTDGDLPTVGDQDLLHESLLGFCSSKRTGVPGGICAASGRSASITVAMTG